MKDSFKVQTTTKSNLIEDDCIHCRKCIDDNFCSFNALKWDEEKAIPIIDIIACEGCNACEWLCPEKAFKIEPVNSGTISHLKSTYGFSVISGETILGAQTSGKLVTELKQYTDKIAKSKNISFVIIDGPPGIGCPVIAMVSNLSYAIVIIEPTSAALHDAIRVTNVIKNFNIPFGVIINKSDMWQEGYQNIIKYLKDNNIELLGEIPLDDEWPKSVAKGLPIIKHKPDGVSAKIIKDIALKFKKMYELYLQDIKND